jgi:hypothetical protein
MTQQLTQQLNMISSGWEVYGSDNDKIGTVDEVGPDYIVVRKGLIFTKDIFVPHSAIERLDTNQTAVFLNVPKSQIEEMGWDDVPPGDTGWTQPAGTTDQTYRTTDETYGTSPHTATSDPESMRQTETTRSPRADEGQGRARGGGDKVEDAVENEDERDRRADRRW